MLIILLFCLLVVNLSGSDKYRKNDRKWVDSKYCFFFRLYYKPGTFLDGTPTIVNGNGDGTVNIRSLQGCLHWQGLQKKNIYYQTFEKVNHMQILSDNQTLNYIKKLIHKVNNRT